MVLQGFRNALSLRDLFDSRYWPATTEAQALVSRGIENLGALEVVRLNRLTVESLFPNAIAASQPNQHTKLGVPGFKGLFIPLSFAYVFFVIFTITAMSNAVNLTDGLDGLAAGTSMISICTFAAIAYVVSRVDWSSYLYVTYVPEASELFVFGAAVLGTTLGFLWFNAHPAQMFMGDVGSLPLGAVLGMVAVVSKDRKSVV